MKEYNLILGEADRTFNIEKDYPLGPWCFTNSKELGKRYGELLDTYDFDDPLENADKKRKAYHFCVTVYTYLFPLFIEQFKLETKTNYENRFYENFLYIYVLIPIFLVQGRYEYIKSFFHKHKDKKFNIIVNISTPPLLDEDLFYMSILNDIKVNEWIMVEIIKYINPENIKFIYLKGYMKKYKISDKYFNFNLSSNPSRKEKIRNFLQNFAYRIENKSLFPIFQLLILQITMFMKAFILSVLTKKNLNQTFIENKTSNIDSEIIKFGTFTLDVINKIFPTNVVNKFSTIDKKELRHAKKIKFINNSTIIDTLSKQVSSLEHRIYVAHLIRLKAKIFYIQHGGHYECVENLWNILIEFNRDGFISWGKHLKHFQSKCKFFSLTFPHLKQLSLLSKKKIVKNNNILFVSTAMRTLYSTSIACSNIGCSFKRVKQQALFFCNLTDENASKIIYRPLLSDLISSLDSVSYIKSKDPRYLKMQFLKTHSLMLEANTYRILVFDYYSTTFLQCLAADVPMILFMEKDNHCFDEIFMQFLERFQQINMLFATPKAAANWLNDNGNTPQAINDWWHSPEVVLVKDDFKKNYIKLNKYPIIEWCKNL